jgi:adenylate kinase
MAEKPVQASEGCEPTGAVRILILGPPGCGKGTQSEKIISHFGVWHLSTGDLLREEIAKKSKIGRKISKVMESGGLVHDDVVIELVKQSLDNPKAQYVFKSFPNSFNC